LHVCDPVIACGVVGPLVIIIGAVFSVLMLLSGQPAPRVLIAVGVAVFGGGLAEFGAWLRRL